MKKLSRLLGLLMALSMVSGRVQPRCQHAHRHPRARARYSRA